MLLLDEERQALKNEKELLRDFINDEEEDSDSVIIENQGGTSSTAKREQSTSNSRSRSSSASDHGTAVTTHEISLPLSHPAIGHPALRPARVTCAQEVLLGLARLCRED